MRLHVGAAALLTGWFGFIACSDAFTGTADAGDAGAGGEPIGSAGVPGATEGGSSSIGDAGTGSIEPGEGGTAGTGVVVGMAGEGMGGSGTVTPGPLSITNCAKEMGGGTCRTVIAVGSWTTCAIATNGTVKCWGLNDHLQLGDSDKGHEACPMDEQMRDCSSKPVAVLGLEQAARLAGGEVSNCALNTLGHLYCWGQDLRAGVDFESAERLGTSEGSTALSVRLPFGVLPGDGKVWVGGLDIQGNGVFGSGDFPAAGERRPQAAVVGLEDAIAFDVGWYHACAVREAGGVVCWGKDVSGELGDGAKMNRNSLVTVKGVTSAVTVAVGDGSSCALRGNGELFCWGVGHPGVTAQPSKVSTPANVIDVRGGFGHFCVLRDNGHVACWGRNDHGQSAPLSAGDTVGAPSNVDGIDNAVAIGVGARHSCALLGSGKLVCWGANQFGQLGTGKFADSDVPVEVLGL